MPDPVELSVVIPAYNEAARLPSTIAAIMPYLQSRGIRFELVLVDDGSQDRTLELMREAALQWPCVQVVGLPANRGKGRAIAAGVESSRGSRVLISDADLSTPIQELSKLEAVMANGTAVAIASRGKRESVQVKQPLPRMLMGKIFNLIVQVVVLPGLWDTQCGFKLFPGAAARELFAGMLTDGFAFDVEILYRARKRGLKVVEVPVNWQHSEPSRVAPIRHSFDMFKDVFRIRFRV